MWTPDAPGFEPRYDSRGQLAARLQALNGRIDGLSRALGVDLGDELQLGALLRDATHGQRRGEGLAAAERRLAHKRMELRGLVVMRYALTTHTIEVLGHH